MMLIQEFYNLKFILRKSNSIIVKTTLCGNTVGVLNLKDCLISTLKPVAISS